MSSRFGYMLVMVGIVLMIYARTNWPLWGYLSGFLLIAGGVLEALEMARQRRERRRYFDELRRQTGTHYPDSVWEFKEAVERVVTRKDDKP